LGLTAIVILSVLAVRVYHQNQERERIISEAMTAGGHREERELREPSTPGAPESPPTPARPRAESAPSPVPPKAATTPVAPAPRPGVVGRSADLGPVKAAPLPSSPPPPRRTVSPAAPSRESRPAIPPEKLDVVVQLSVKDRSAAERDLSTLLARVGATQVQRQPDFTFIVVVPQSRYGEFTRGMAQIGSWQMETDRSTVPDPVRVAVRLVSRRSGPS